MYQIRMGIRLQDRDINPLDKVVLIMLMLQIILVLNHLSRLGNQVMYLLLPREVDNLLIHILHISLVNCLVPIRVTQFIRDLQDLEDNNIKL